MATTPPPQAWTSRLCPECRAILQPHVPHPQPATDAPLNGWAAPLPPWQEHSTRPAAPRAHRLARPLAGSDSGSRCVHHMPVLLLPTAPVRAVSTCKHREPIPCFARRAAARLRSDLRKGCPFYKTPSEPCFGPGRGLPWPSRPSPGPPAPPPSPGVAASAAACAPGWRGLAVSPPAWALSASISVLIWATTFRKLVFWSCSRWISLDGKLFLASS